MCAEVSLASYTAAKHWLILIFFPKAWSFICPTEIRAFSARLEEFLYSRQCAVVFASTDNEYCLKAWNATSELEGGLGGVHVPLMADTNHKLCRDYGVLIEETGVAQRALFIIDPRGTVRAITINDADVGRSVDEAQRVLDALAFKDECGEGCPVDWKKGDKGIDMGSKAEPAPAVENPVGELRKSWAEWVKPTLQRANSAASQRSITSIMSDRRRNLVMNDACMNGSAQSLAPTSGGLHSTMASGQNSPGLVSPHSNIFAGGNGNGKSKMEAQMEDAMVQQRLENAQAALQNSSLGVSATT